MSEIKNVIKDHIRWRKQIFKLAKAEIVKTYSGTALGWSWAIIRPAITISIYWFAFSIGLKDTTRGEYPFVLWLVCGIISWFYIRDMLNSGTASILQHKYLVTKMKFPVSTIPTFVSLSHLAVNAALVVLVIIIYVFCGYYPDVYYIQILFYMLLMFLFFTGWALFASMIAAMSKDFLNLIKSLVIGVFWLSGILWDPSNVDIPWLQKLLLVNPVTYIVNGYRDCFLNKVWFFENPKLLAIFLAELLIMWLMAMWSYKKLRKEIADVL